MKQMHVQDDLDMILNFQDCVWSQMIIYPENQFDLLWVDIENMELGQVCLYQFGNLPWYLCTEKMN